MHLFEANGIMSKQDIKFSYILYIKSLSIFAEKNVRSLTIFQQITAVDFVSTVRLYKLETNDFV